MAEKHKCPVCNELTLDEERNYDVCDNCWWEDDPYQFENPDYKGGANKLSLNEAKEKFNAGEDLREYN